IHDIRLPTIAMPANDWSAGSRAHTKMYNAAIAVSKLRTLPHVQSHWNSTRRRQSAVMTQNRWRWVPRSGRNSRGKVKIHTQDSARQIRRYKGHLALTG